MSALRRHERVIMGLTLTLVIMLASLIVAGLANWLERRPREVGTPPPLVSYPAIQMIAVVTALLMAAHLVSLVTGTPLESRFGS